MDAVNFFSTLWRHRLWTLPLLVLVVAAVGYVALVGERTYEARADLVLIGPPGPPSTAELEADPSLATASFDNPYTRSFDPTVVTEIVARVVAAEPLTAALPSGYRIAAGRQYGSTAPLVEIAARSPDPQIASANASAVAAAFVDTLERLQMAENVHPRALITTRFIDTTADPREVVTQRLRAAVGVAALGIFGLLILITAAQVVADMRARDPLRRTRTLGPSPAGSSVRELPSPSADTH